MSRWLSNGRIGKRLLQVSVLALAPLLAAPYFPGCGHSHGVFPHPCTVPGVGACPEGENSDHSTLLAFAQAEERLAEAEVTSVPFMGLLADWTELERCQPMPRSTPLPDGVEEIYNNPSIPRYCYRDLRTLRSWLRYFVAHKGTHSSCNGGRVGFIQLAPIFSEANRLPDYLNGHRFNDLAVFWAFLDLWDALLEELSDPAYVLSTGERASWHVSLGNEIDMYLNDRDQPYPIGASSPYPDPLTRWADYSSFYQAVTAYMDATASAANVPLAIGTTVRWGKEASPGDGVCGPFELYQHSVAGTSCTYNTARLGVGTTATVTATEAGTIWLHHMAMASTSDLFIYTRYFPDFLGKAPPQSYSTLKTQFQAALEDDFANMAFWSEVATYLEVTETNLPFVIQEISYPSARTSQSNPTSFEKLVAIAANGIANQQGAMAAAALDARKAHNQSNPAAHLLSLNWFMLHDFAASLCTSGSLPWPMPFCSWGLFTAGAEEKDQAHSQSETAWENFRTRSVQVNDGGVDPPRASCPP